MPMRKRTGQGSLPVVLLMEFTAQSGLTLMALAALILIASIWF